MNFFRIHLRPRIQQMCTDGEAPDALSPNVPFPPTFK
jgi:hypothetical protein